MKNKFIMIALAMGSLGFSQGLELDSTIVETVNTIPYVLDTTKVEVTVPTEKQSQSTVCGKPTSKNTPCKNKTKHESGSCHHHRD